MAQRYALKIRAAKCRGRHAHMGTEAIEIDSGVTSQTTSRCHVLVVDDDAAEHERVANCLTLNDFCVTPGENGKRMMEIIRDEALCCLGLNSLCTAHLRLKRSGRRHDGP
jgi:PleD family two-component response regulator